MLKPALLMSLILTSTPAFAVGFGTGADTCLDPQAAWAKRPAGERLFAPSARLKIAVVEQHCKTARQVDFVLRAVSLNFSSEVDLSGLNVTAVVSVLGRDGKVRNTVIPMTVNGSQAQAVSKRPVDLVSAVRTVPGPYQSVSVRIFADDRILAESLFGR